MATADSVTAETPSAALARRPSRWRSAGREILLVLAGVVVYFGVRGVTVTDAQEALDHALDLVALEKAMGLYVEPSLQTLVLGSDWLVDVMNWVYIWGHWPVIAVVLLWLFLAHPAGYRRTRNAMLISGGIGLMIFASFPVAPPRLAGLGLIDTVTEHSSAYRVLQPPAFVNQYAAMPSLHVGWDLLMGLAVYSLRATHRRSDRRPCAAGADGVSGAAHRQPLRHRRSRRCGPGAGEHGGRPPDRTPDVRPRAPARAGRGGDSPAACRRAGHRRDTPASRGDLASGG